MRDMWAWYEEIVIDTGRQPLFLALIAFILTFIITRFITRLIRSGRGPFGNVSAGGVHVHHVVPGVVAVLAGGLMGFSANRHGIWFEVGAVLFGIGAALVLDEFAMILHLDDVYWKKEGRLSADAVLIAIAFMGASLVIASPSDPPGPPETDPIVGALIPILFVLLWVIPIGVTMVKGKLLIGAVAMIFPVIAWVAAFRLARPNSPWAHVRYTQHPQLMARSRERYARLDKKWEPAKRWFEERIFGFSDDPDPDSDEGSATESAPGPSSDPRGQTVEESASASAEAGFDHKH